MSDAVVAVACIVLGTIVTTTGVLMHTTWSGTLERRGLREHPAAAVLGGLVLVVLGIGVSTRGSSVTWVTPACLVVAILLGVATAAVGVIGPSRVRPEDGSVEKERT